MRHRLVLAALLLPLAGCDVPQQPAPTYAYAAPGYPQPEYSPGGDPGYPPPGYNTEVDPGFDYNNGAPTIIEGGAAVPLVLYGGEWGFYDHERHWHRAPDQVYHHMQQYQHQGWGGNPGAPPPHYPGNPPPRYEGHPPQAYGGPPPGPPPGVGRYGGPPPGPPPGVGRYGGPPPGRPPEAVRPAAVPAFQAPRPAPPPPAQAAPMLRQDREQHTNRGCQPNQHC